MQHPVQKNVPVNQLGKSTRHKKYNAHLTRPTPMKDKAMRAERIKETGQQKFNKKRKNTNQVKEKQTAS